MVKRIEIEQVVKVVLFQTTDGKKFETKYDAELHQDILDGKKKLCQTCLGTKYESYQKAHFQPGIENGGYPTSITNEKRTCPTCSGRGFLELKFV
jgi:hypothetical protein